MMLFVFTDRPTPPESVEAFDVYEDNCKVKWKPPTDDGGAEITDYVVEKCQDGFNFWEKVPGIVKDNTINVKELEKGKKYKFRVRAANMYGESDPAETSKSILAKNPYGKETAHIE